MIEIRYANILDKDIYFELDKHLDKNKFIDKINNNEIYLLFSNDILIGILRYSLFWDQFPFCNLIIIKNDYQHIGYGGLLLKYFENDMKIKIIILF